VLCASFVVQSSTGKYIVQACSTRQYSVLLKLQSNTGASFVAQSGTMKYFVQALSYQVLLGSVLCKLCSTK